MEGHKIVSSETSMEYSQEQHKETSSENQLPPPKDDMVAEDFKGITVSGELEAVADFDPLRAMKESGELQEVPVTGDLDALPDAGALEFGLSETVCGRDDRVRITPATNIPWRWICELIITFADGVQARGTGWFIGPRTVMTAGHCVYSHSNGGWARSIEVIPGMDGASRPFGSQVGTSFRSVLGWTRDQNQEYDYGAIILPNCQLGNRVGWFGFAVLSDSSLQGLTVNNSGYPGDKPFGTQWFNAGAISTVRPRKIYYMIDTYGGQSGSPVWRLLNGERHAVGVHAYGGCPNSATRITTEVFNNMLAWRNIPC
ncbi:MAG: serine protease [Microcystis sp. M048S1]|nr:endopeptidase [Microcystis aeruginosa NIES-88]MCA2723332.1 serine protease [Microcystis sp. M176S2]MCA2728251.1 serine protease [Microcystis sp. M166S2]MCA2728364.1 serine protease [Microcystis sp. M162S2]MCA2745110.1 serine protease [Microcystis sp. M155S2]MCA2766161.1 serine protease [Microcystis sp. M152S2]MCA2777239.1 serine protease [Microcystis sp. M135S2]MCA2777860.1 serine protease [Microcystis sp. M136S2]MCA2785488.1 serine protease [Microcystis sp. M125S2]MCA2791236.1 serine p